MNKKLGIITSSRVPDLLDYDRELLAMYQEIGFDAEAFLWDSGKDVIDKYDFYLMRTAWDYFFRPAEFKEFLNYLGSTKKLVLNPVDVMIWNMHKFYLNEIRDRGFDLIPTFFAEKGGKYDLKEILKDLDTDKFIIKPAISAASNNTMLYIELSTDSADHLDNLLNTGDALIQTYMPEIVSIGEYSNIFFSNGFSYTVLKQPSKGDYRIQREYGGKYSRIDPPKHIFETAQSIASFFLDKCLYVRVDGVESDGKFYLMEVEMIEPDLYMNIVPEAKREFVDSLKKKLK